MSHEHDWPEVPPLAADEFAMPAVIVCTDCGASRTIPGTNRPRIERACGLCRRYGHDDDECPTNPATWPIPPMTSPSSAKFSGDW
jgi:hypothetical protein